MASQNANPIKDQNEWNRQLAVCLALKRKFGGIIAADPAKRKLSFTFHPAALAAITGKPEDQNPLAVYKAHLRKLQCSDARIASIALQAIQEASPTDPAEDRGRTIGGKTIDRG